MPIATPPPVDFTPEELVLAIIQARADGDTDAATHLMTLLKEPDDDV